MTAVIKAEEEEGQGLAVILHLEVTIQKDLKEVKRNHDIHGLAAVRDTNQRIVTSSHHQIQAEYVLEILQGQETNLEEIKEDLAQDLHPIADHVEGLDPGHDHTKRKKNLQGLVLKVLVPDLDPNVIVKNQDHQVQKVIIKESHKDGHVPKIEADENRLQHHGHHQQIQKTD